MKIACIDNTEGDREALKCVLDRAYADCRSAIGHIEIANYYSTTKDRELISGNADIVIIGPGFNENEAFITCRTFKELRKKVYIIVFLDRDHYDICSLKRFSSVADQIFKIDEDSQKIIHTISLIKDVDNTSHIGKLVSVIGTKGGVGTTSIVSGLAHAAEALNKKALVLDLSSSATLCHYLGIRRWHSPEYQMLIQNKSTLDYKELDKCIAVAENGIHLLLPPAEPIQSSLISSKTRNSWLRDENCLELNLHFIELLKESYDLIIVDTARVESLLSFALVAKADSNILVSSNDPASVYLLRKEFETIKNSPFSGQTQIILNEIFSDGQNKESVIDYLKIHGIYDELTFLLDPIPYEKNGRHWIGTGNSFYTESSNTTKKKLEQCLETSLLSSIELTEKQGKPNDSNKQIYKYIPFLKKSNKRLKAIGYNCHTDELELIRPNIKTRSTKSVNESDEFQMYSQPTAINARSNDTV